MLQFRTKVAASQIGQSVYIAVILANLTIWLSHDIDSLHKSMYDFFIKNVYDV